MSGESQPLNVNATASSAGAASTMQPLELEDSEAQPIFARGINRKLWQRWYIKEAICEAVAMAFFVFCGAGAEFNSNVLTDIALGVRVVVWCAVCGVCGTVRYECGGGSEGGGLTRPVCLGWCQHDSTARLWR